VEEILSFGGVEDPQKGVRRPNRQEEEAANVIDERLVPKRSFGERRKRPDLAHAKHTSAQERIWDHRFKRGDGGKIGRRREKCFG
jgi:hypothetical protein